MNFHPPAPALLPPGILVPSPWLLGYLCTFCTLSEKKLGVCMIFYDQNIFSDIAVDADATTFLLPPEYDWDSAIAETNNLAF